MAALLISRVQINSPVLRVLAEPQQRSLDAKLRAFRQKGGRPSAPRSPFLAGTAGLTSLIIALSDECNLRPNRQHNASDNENHISRNPMSGYWLVGSRLHELSVLAQC